MSGLIEKDLRLLLQREQSFILFIAIAILLSFNTNSFFMLAYLPIVFIMLVIGTVSYDEFDNGYPFLLTLPITRNTYVYSKYILSIIIFAITWIFSVSFCFIKDVICTGVMPADEMLMTSLIMLPLPIIFIDIALPIQLKFGAERARTAIIAIIGGIMIIGYFGIKLFSNIGVNIEELLYKFETIPEAVFAILLFIISIIATVISIAISSMIMNKKEM